VTPTYYVFFTSATIVTSAVLFQGFKGTPLQIVTVIMGFFQICSGVVLLQLSKSAKDVPDAAVFKGDLDQVRQVAEVEEPEYEPRADALRGGGAILRSLSRARSEKELQEARRIKEEHMQPIGEGEQVEFDGIRRRRTIVDPNRPPTRSATIVNSKVPHPPLGMSRFPEYDSDEDDNSSFHPGFFQRLRSRGKSTSSRTSSHAMGPSNLGMKTLPPIPTDGASDKSIHQDTYKQVMQEDTSYKPHDSTHIQFAELQKPSLGQDRIGSSESLPPPRPPPHTAKRQFSFTNVFGRNRSESQGESSRRPTSRHSRKTSGGGKAAATEEERLGLVKGDSSHLLTIPSHDSEGQGQVYSDSSPVKYTGDNDWTAIPRTTSPGYSPIRSPSPQKSGGVRRVETPEIDPKDPENYEKGGPKDPYA